MRKNLEIFTFCAILLGGLFVRLYRFDNPILDWHAWRQADTSAVSRNFVNKGFDVLHPRFDDLSNVPSGIDNPNGYRFVEFPVYNIFQAGFFKILPAFTLEEWGRLITIFSSLLTTLFLYLLVKKHSNTVTAIFTAFFFTFIPYDIYYGRTILPDPSMVMTILGGIYFFDTWIQENQKSKIKNQKFQFKIQKYFFLSFVFTAIAFLLKPYAFFFTLPMIYLAFQRFGFNMVRNWRLWLFTLISVVPLLLWRLWIGHYPEGIPASVWLLNGNGIRFRPAFFRWILYERLLKLISGYFGVVIFLTGFLELKKNKEAYFFLSFVLASLLYVFVFATGNVQHDYYQILIMPTIAMLYGLGAYFLYSYKKHFAGFYIGKLILIVCSIGLFWFGWYQVKDYFNINNPALLTAGEAVDKFIPKDAKIIAPLDGDTSFLYQTKRQGWASFEKPMPQMIAMGASYLVMVHPPKDNDLKKKYKVITETSQFILVRLVSQK